MPSAPQGLPAQHHTAMSNQGSSQGEQEIWINTAIPTCLLLLTTKHSRHSQEAESWLQDPGCRLSAREKPGQEVRNRDTEHSGHRPAQCVLAMRPPAQPAESPEVVSGCACVSHTVLILAFANTPVPGRCATCCTRTISCGPQNEDPKGNLISTAICRVSDLPTGRTQTTSVGCQGPGTVTPDQTSGAHNSLSCEFSPKTLQC